MRKMGGLVPLVLCLLLGACAPAEQPKGTSVPSGPLISAALLDSLLDDSSAAISLIDVRPAAEFIMGHIPSAVNVWRPDLADERFPFSSITAPKDKLESVFGKLGLQKEVLTVVYDGKMNADAANLWWIFRLAGGQNVKILDGGLAAWKKAGLKSDSGEVAVVATTFQFQNTPDSSQYASLEDVRSALNDPEYVILDTRTLEEYSGEMVKEGAKRGGHIPGSIWLNYTEATAENEGCCYLKPITDLQAMFSAKGITRDKKIICYCHSGVRSAHTTFVLSQLLGYPNVRNFDGSWEEWTQNDALPVQLGGPEAEKMVN